MLKDRAARDDSKRVRQEVVHELARGWKNDPGTLTLLKERAARDESERVRQEAVQELARRWKDDPGVRAFLDGLTGPPAGGEP